MLMRIVIIVGIVSVLIAGGLNRYNKHLQQRYNQISRYNKRIVIYRQFNKLPLDKAIQHWNNNTQNINEIMFDLQGQNP